MPWLIRRSNPSAVVLPLDDLLADRAQRLADFARMHQGSGPRLERVPGADDQIIRCVCGGDAASHTGSYAAAALAEDEFIDDS